MSKTVFTRNESDATLTIERTFSAPRDRVWQAYTDPGILDQWWAPRPWRAETKSMQFVVGGHWHYAMIGPDGEQHFGRMDFLEIEPGHRYKASDSFTDAEGRIDRSLPVQTFETTFSDAGEGTKVVVLVEYASLADMQRILEMGMQEGLTMAQDQLEALLRE